jgi:RecJ-like exonuclease
MSDDLSECCNKELHDVDCDECMSSGTDDDGNSCDNCDGEGYKLYISECSNCGQVFDKQ